MASDGLSSKCGHSCEKALGLANTPADLRQREREERGRGGETPGRPRRFAHGRPADPAGPPLATCFPRENKTYLRVT